MDKRTALIWLNSIGISSDRINKLSEWANGLTNIYDLSKEEIKNSGLLSPSQQLRFFDKNRTGYLTDYIKRVRITGAEIITILDDVYPDSLRTIADSPKVLYVKGSFLKEDSISISIVGSRKATAYGRWASESFTKDLVKLGVTIVSGLATGIDSYAHRTAIDNNGRTIGILGCGIDIIYPKKNRNLFEEVERAGAIVSEFPLGTPPLQHHFPMRNRIISGMSLGVLVIEAQEKSGTLITAGFAAEQGREVFALPGNINSLYSKGTNLLIRDGARPLLSVEDIIEEIPELKQRSMMKKLDDIGDIPLSETERKIVDILKEGPLHCDIIALRTGLNVSTVLGTLTILEMKQVIQELGSRVYMIS
ncbi:MAG: DNA-processing protein DprA [Gudongella sp.]|jgi:DNA processing protein|nr:DNA-processing protein DprA [Gudongella sp.]